MRVSVNLNAQKPDTTTNAVIYARYSSHGQTEQSIEGQLAKGHEYAAAQGYTVVHEYIDRAMTGRNDNREAFQKMLSDTGKHQFQVVIVWKVDRFGRNREEIAFNKHTCKKNGVRVEYVAESLPNSPEAVILESVLEGMAEYYSIQLSQNIRRGQLESAKKCQCVGGSVPLGYTLDSDKHFVIDPQTAPVVKKIFDLYAEGATISEITGQLNEQGIRTARKQLFTKNSLTKLLKNEKYIGVYTYKDIVRVEGGVPAIVDESTFDRVQELLKINRRAPSHTWTKVEYLLTDKLFCGHCGSPMVGESGFSHTGAKYSYYGCIKRRREKACDKKPVRQDWIEALVLDETVKLLHDDELMEYIIDRTWEYYQVTDKVQEEKAVLEAQLAEVDKAINNLVRAIEAGIFNAATKSRMDELDAQKAALTASLADLELTSGIRITRDHIEYFLLRLRDLDVKDRECQKRLVQTFVNAVFIYDDGRVKITYNYSGQSSTITLNQIASAEKGKGFVCCLPCSRRVHFRKRLVVVVRVVHQPVRRVEDSLCAARPGRVVRIRFVPLAPGCIRQQALVVAELVTADGISRCDVADVVLAAVPAQLPRLVLRQEVVRQRPVGEDVVRNILRGSNRRLLRRLRRGAGRTVRQRRGDGCGRQGIRRIRRVAQRQNPLLSQDKQQ